MNPKKKRTDLLTCQCSAMDPHTIVRDKAYAEHLLYFSPGTSWDDTGYYLCPQTGVVWVSKYVPGFDWRIDDIALEHTGLVLPEFSHYTVARVEVRLYKQPVRVRDDTGQDIYYTLGLPRHIPLPTFPHLPLKGLIIESFFTDDSLSWEWESLRVSGIKSLKTWLYLPEPLNAGGAVEGWLASPFEPISRQVLEAGLHLEWWYLWKQIGEVVVQYQTQVEAAWFREYFSHNPSVRNIGEELDEWVRLARRGRVGRFE